jgi:hypothetical protein
MEVTFYSATKVVFASRIPEVYDEKTWWTGEL